MSFYPRRKRAAPAIIVISLIDVLLVLLVFLLVTTSYRNQPSVKLTLPEVADAPKAGATDSRPPLVVTIAASDPAYFIGNRAVTEDKLGQELQSAAAGNPDLQVVLSADKAAPWEKVARALQMTRRAGIKNIRAYTKGPGSR